MFKNTPYKGLKNVYARITMSRDKRYREFLKDHIAVNPDWKPFQETSQLYNSAFGQDAFKL